MVSSVTEIQLGRFMSSSSASVAACVHCRHADVQFANNPAKYIKYSAADVGSIIDDDLFETKAVSMNKLSLTKEKLGAIV
jgi:hypothetical protein